MEEEEVEEEEYNFNAAVGARASRRRDGEEEGLSIQSRGERRVSSATFSEFEAPLMVAVNFLLTSYSSSIYLFRSLRSSC